ncbi:hypothetical protein FRC09_019994 [Ceratobasidium sp. 395]|nr:hypothetical protein FRC09_019994 [Ceratobasidium sp. 395]
MDELLDDILERNNPFVEEEDPSEADSEAGDDSPVLQALTKLEDLGLSLSALLDAVVFGDETIRSHRKVTNARDDLFSGDVLTRVLTRVRQPPHMRVRGKRHITARESLNSWAVDTTVELLSKELACFAKTTKSPATEADVVDEEALKGLTFDAMYEDIQQYAPRLYNALSRICSGPRQSRNKMKASKFCVTIFINAMANQLSHFNNKMQKLLCIYFKSKSVPKAVYHLFQVCGVTTSYQWSVKALENISMAAMNCATTIFDSQPCMVIYDNVRLPFPVKHQRLDSLTATDNGTAITLIPLRDTITARNLLHNSDLWEQNQLRLFTLYHQRRMSHLSDEDIFTLRDFTAEKQRTIDNIIGILFDAPELKQSLKRMHPVLAKLPPVHQLPVGEENRTRQFMLETICQEEASYGGNLAVTEEIFRQLGYSEPEKHENWALRKRLPTVGDSLTLARLRMLQFMKAEDLTNLERLEHLLLVFGWLHLDMNLVNTTFYHHYGKARNTGLARDAKVSHRAGLTEPTKKKGPQYHILHEFMQHTTTARILGLWLWVSATETVEELAKWVEHSEPETIYEAAETIWVQRASGRALQQFKDDPNLCNTIALTRDLLLRHEVAVSTKTGDVGRMEATLPALLIFFSGAGCKNYARELAETLHWMRYEAPPGVAELIRNECWVLNTQGLPDSFYPFDLRQELNNLSIKQEHGPPPTGCTWESHRRWSPALPTLTAVAQHVEENFHDYYRSKKHYTPSSEKDIKLFIARHKELGIYHYNPNRPENKTEKRAHDCVAVGRVNIMEKNYLGQLALEREQYFGSRSRLNRPRYKNLPKEETIQLMAQEHAQAHSQDTTIDRLIQSITDELEVGEGDEPGDEGDEGEQNDLHYEVNEPELDEDGDPAYQETRHALIDGWCA